MKVIYSKLPSKRTPCVATIGVFDGIHRGHQFILKKLTAAAKKNKCHSLAITFDVLPQQFFARNPSLNSWQLKKPFLGCLTDDGQKTPIMRSFGIDYLWYLKTQKSLLELSPHDFIAYVNKYFYIKRLIIGEDFRFGRGGKGDVKYMRKLAKEYNFTVSVVKKRRKGNEAISSSRIRGLVGLGKLQEVAELLGRPFSLRGTVCRGRRLGTQLKIPTANIYPFDYITPARGVYTACVFFKGKAYTAVANVGIKPTVSRSKKTTIEVHMINFRGNILGKVIEVIFLEKIRNERKFSSLTSLKAAIEGDIKLATSKCSISPL